MDIQPLPFSFPYAIAFWGTYIWAFYLSEWNMIRRSAKTMDSQAIPKKSELKWIGTMMLVAQFVAFAVSFWDVAPFPPAGSKPAFFLGIVLIIVGSALRRHCFRMLGANFTIDVRAHENQTIVDQGAYALVRHPSYTAGLIMVVGLGLALGSYLSLVIITTVTLFAYLQRIGFEEQTLTAALGEKYLAYARGRKRLMPYIY
ncbi:MAG: isoprenylcysteine carboxylmethyltransferase family protein [Alphaproteobacteria bacterium]|nr:isoprenylcysteine carboxylmethyltransferase family protein [Alphaproteobacteria bacterium]